MAKDILDITIKDIDPVYSESDPTHPIYNFNRVGNYYSASINKDTVQDYAPASEIAIAVIDIQTDREQTINLEVYFTPYQFPGIQDFGLNFCEVYFDPADIESTVRPASPEQNSTLEDEYKIKSGNGNTTIYTVDSPKTFSLHLTPGTHTVYFKYVQENLLYSKLYGKCGFCIPAGNGSGTIVRLLKADTELSYIKLNTNDFIKRNELLTSLSVQNIQAADPFTPSAVTVTNIMPQTNANPAYPQTRQIGSSTSAWDSGYINNIAATTITATSGIIDTVLVHKLQLTTAEGATDRQIQLKDEHNNLICIERAGIRRIAGKDSSSSTMLVS